ncbi:hypothetical protein [Levilactobacillus mulengensis]|uniref:hypothetical protein n=1 Tax=Levilactobacillus mulengensis TaxID=2486025 RepID=UPI000F789AE3|nr:hypothetical protein [Levilactobacillus mulengensis]
MEPLNEQIMRISQEIGVSMAAGEEISSANLPLNRSDQKNTRAALGEVLDQLVFFVAYDGDRVLRPLAFMSRLKQMNPNRPVILCIAQLSTRERRTYLQNAIPFITADGETFLPFLGLRLHPRLAVSSGKIPDEKFASAEQRLALTVLFAQLVLERRQDAENLSEMVPFKHDGDLFLMTGGQRFVSAIGERVGIKNRVTFNRAASQLVKRGLLKFSGETKNRVYSCRFNSRSFFNNIKQFLISPIQNSGSVRLNFYPEEVSEIDALYTGITGLAKVTMIGDDTKLKTLVVSRSERNLLDCWADKVSPSVTPVCVLQISRYDLNGFNWLFRLGADYPKDVVDPIHLFTMFRNDSDERTQGEAAELVDQIWSRE